MKACSVAVHSRHSEVQNVLCSNVGSYVGQHPWQIQGKESSVRLRLWKTPTPILYIPFTMRDLPQPPPPRINIRKMRPTRFMRRGWPKKSARNYEPHRATMLQIVLNPTKTKCLCDIGGLVASCSQMIFCHTRSTRTCQGFSDPLLTIFFTTFSVTREWLFSFGNTASRASLTVQCSTRACFMAA